MSRTGLAIFVKTPGCSPIKTRLAAGHGRAFAEDFHRRSAQAVAAVARAAAAIAPHWAVAEAEAMDEPQWAGLPRLPQGSGSLGERMARVHATLLSRHRAALLIGADAPQIEPTQLQAASDWLDCSQPRCVIGPAADGGFWLFGSNRPVPPARWTSVAYSRPSTADAFRVALHDLGDWLELPCLVDADEPADLGGVLAALAALDRPLDAQRALAVWLRDAGRVAAGAPTVAGAKPTHA